MKFVEFTEESGKTMYVRPDAVNAVAHGQLGNTCISHGALYSIVTEPPSEVVAKLQGQPEPHTYPVRYPAPRGGSEWMTSDGKRWNDEGDALKQQQGIDAMTAAPPAESEAVKLLERWLNSRNLTTKQFAELAESTVALLAKLKGGA